MALKRRGAPGRVFALLSDAECNEGQVWGGGDVGRPLLAVLMVDNLIALVADDNGMQAMGPTEGVLNMRPLAPRWTAFGWQAVDVDGHDPEAIRAALTTGIADRRGPAVIIARTELGKGVSFMENRLEWHYRGLSPELATQALHEVEGRV